MARELAHGAVGVRIKPTLICTVSQNVDDILIQNVSDTDVFVGGSGVASSGDHQGFLLKPGESQVFPTFEFDSTDVYAVARGDGDKARVVARVVFVVSS
jgi:hypothetical protein